MWWMFIKMKEENELDNFLKSVLDKCKKEVIEQTKGMETE